MVIGRSFAWAHLPRTAGTATLAMFELFPDLIEHIDPAESEQQHAKFADRESEVAGKLLALNFRRLPEWVLSRAHRVSRFGVAPDYVPAPMQPAAELMRSTLPDERLAEFTGHGRFAVDRWLRVDRLAADFLELIGELTDIAPDQRERVQAMPQINAIDYDHEIRHWFTPEQVGRMYGHNPQWAALERRLWGDLLTGA